MIFLPEKFQHRNSSGLNAKYTLTEIDIFHSVGKNQTSNVSRGTDLES